MEALVEAKSDGAPSDVSSERPTDVDLLFPRDGSSGAPRVVRGGTCDGSAVVSSRSSELHKLATATRNPGRTSVVSFPAGPYSGVSNTKARTTPTSSSIEHSMCAVSACSGTRVVGRVEAKICPGILQGKNESGAARDVSFNNKGDWFDADRKSLSFVSVSPFLEGGRGCSLSDESPFCSRLSVPH